MKKIYIISIATISILLSIIACENKEEVSYPPLYVATGTILMSADSGSTAAFQVASKGLPWAITSDQSWCKVSPESGNEDIMVNVTLLQKNPTTRERLVKLAVTGTEANYELTVKQQGAAPVLSTSPVSIQATDLAGTDSIFIETNSDWTVEIETTVPESGWCTLSSYAGFLTDTIIVHYTANLTTDVRSANINFKAGSVTKKVTLNQAVSPNALRLDPEKINVDATASSQTVQVFMFAGVAWTATIDPSGNGWCTFSGAGSGTGDGSFTINLATLPESSNGRTTTITVVAGAMSKIIPVTQSHYMTDSRDGKKYKIVKMPDEKWWMAENLNYTKDLFYNTLSTLANGATFSSSEIQAPIGSYWYPAAHQVTTSGDSTTDGKTYGALYSWNTAMMLDGEWSDATRTSSTWDNAWITYNGNNAAPNTTAGKINHARNNGQGICPPGWHIPTDFEWAVMLDAVDGNGTDSVYQKSNSTSGAVGIGVDAGKKLKSANTCSSGACATEVDAKWDYYTTNPANAGIDLFGFNILPAGQRAASYYQNRGRYAYIWTSSAGSSSSIRARVFMNSLAGSIRPNNIGPTIGNSVRCIKD